MGFDVEAVRAGYPALAEGYAHFDGAAGTLVAEPVAAAVAGVLRGAVANRTPLFAPGRRAIRIVEEARAAVADLVGGVPDGIAFGPSATALTYTVARTLADGWGPGDEVVVTRLDHDANVRPWVQAAGRAGATVRFAQIDPATGVLPLDNVRAVIGPRTKLVAVTAASNVAGAMPDVAAIATLAHAVGALCYVDGVHATPHGPVDVVASGADFYVTSAYKWSGPHIAACAAAPSTWEGLRPDKLVPSSDDVPDRFEYGTSCFELLAGVTAAVEHLASLAPSGGGRRERVLASMTAVRDYEADLFGRLRDGLAGVPGIEFVPAGGRRCPTVSFRVAGQSPEETAVALASERICVFAGNYYAVEFFGAIGWPGAVRAGIYHYTTAAEVDLLVGALGRVAKG